MPDAPPPGWSQAETAARASYGRLVAHLAWRWRDLASAEDALSSALLAALEHWPRTGVPDAPDAWLLTTARRALLQAARHRRVEQAPETLAVLEPDLQAPDTPDVPDHRLRLMFVCAHPALAPAMHAPLMLQAVLGLHAETLAQAFLYAGARSVTATLWKIGDDGAAAFAERFYSNLRGMGPAELLDYDRMKLRGTWIEIACNAVWNIRDGKVALWQDYYDLGAYLEGMKAAGIALDPHASEDPSQWAG